MWRMDLKRTRPKIVGTARKLPQQWSGQESEGLNQGVLVELQQNRLSRASCWSKSDRFLVSNFGNWVTCSVIKLGIEHRHTCKQVKRKPRF